MLKNQICRTEQQNIQARKNTPIMNVAVHYVATYTRSIQQHTDVHMYVQAGQQWLLNSLSQDCTMHLRKEKHTVSYFCMNLKIQSSAPNLKETYVYSTLIGRFLDYKLVRAHDHHSQPVTLFQLQLLLQGSNLPLCCSKDTPYNILCGQRFRFSSQNDIVQIFSTDTHQKKKTTVFKCTTVANASD